MNAIDVDETAVEAVKHLEVIVTPRENRQPSLSKLEAAKLGILLKLWK